mmetsp:Transcript_3503/g.2081  ORF Transcript_3503/g.2081 Transcript_3503/m.2081 type:complete len:145 (+) Transcript_3503:6216-6650(+)
MTHGDVRHYAAKHPKGTKCDPQITESLKQKVSDGRITCTYAHKIADNLNISPAKVGVNIDLLEIRLNKCQLGLFGYGEQKKAVKPVVNISQELDKAIKKSITDGSVSCKSCWDVAIKIGCSKLDVSGACEILKIKISPCQLGAF